MLHAASTSFPPAWAFALALAAAVSTAGLFCWLVQRARARRRARLAARRRQRERQAFALHDSLLQGMQCISLRLQTAINPLPAQDPLRRTIESVLDEMDQLVANGRDQVMELRTEPDDGSDLRSTLRTALHTLAAQHGVQSRLLVEGAPLRLHPMFSEDVDCIAREAMANAFRHGGASKVEVLLGYGVSAFHLHVRDNGRGMDEHALGIGGRRSHWGLSGMRERAACIGGQLDIWSGAGKGTEVVFSLPAALAYGQQAAAHAWLERILFRHY